MLDTLMKTASKRPADSAPRRFRGQYIEADFSRPDGCALYGGFGDTVTGVFIPTYTSIPMGTEIGIRLLFDRNLIKTAQGMVEWTRELNPLSPETEPGLGIRILRPDTALRALLERLSLVNPPMFYDNTQERYAQLLAPSTPPRTQPRPASPSKADAGPPADSGTDFDGLLADIAALLARRSSEGESSDSTSGPAFVPSKRVYNGRTAGFSCEIHAQPASEFRSNRQFHGGFCADDDGKKVFIRTTESRPVGTRILLLLHLSDGRRFDALGSVRWVRKHNPMVSPHLAPPGLGIRLDDRYEGVLPGTGIRGRQDDVLLCEEIRYSARGSLVN